MNRLDRYITRRWFFSFIPVLIVLVAVYIAGDAAFSMLDLVKRGFSSSTIAIHFALKTPTMFYQMTPIAALMATLLTLTGMKRSGEMTAIFVSGWGIVRFSAPFLAVATAVSLFAYHVNESVAPGANRTSRDLVRTGTGSGGSVVGTELIWLLEGNRIIHIRSAQEEGTVLVEPTILQFKGKGLRDLELRIDALQARWKEGTWVADEAYWRTFTDNMVSETRVLTGSPLPIKIRPEEFNRVRRKPEEMNRGELTRYVANLRKAGLPSDWHHVRIYRKSSAAALSLIFTVIALPVGFLVPIRGGMPLGVGLGIFLSIVFWSAFSFCLSLGYSGLLSAPIAAWAAQAIFLSLGLIALAIIGKPRLT